MFLTTVRVRRARTETCANAGVPYASHLVEVCVHGTPRAIVTVESGGRVATVEWHDPDYPSAKLVAAVRAALPLMKVAEPAKAAA